MLSVISPVVGQAEGHNLAEGGLNSVLQWVLSVISLVAGQAEGHSLGEGGLYYSGCCL